MKLHAEGIVTKRNLLGEVLEISYYLYKWTWRGKRYLRTKAFDEKGLIFGEVYSYTEPRINKVLCSWEKEKKFTHYYSARDATFILDDYQINPNKYIMEE